MTEGQKRINECDHGIVFDLKACVRDNLTTAQVRERYPRLDGNCPKGCGLYGIAYANFAHYMAGEWGARR